MKALPGWLYIVAGAVVSGVSMIVRWKVPGNQSMLYFAIIGFIFILIGLYRVWREVKASKAQDSELDRLNMQENINRATQQRIGQPMMGQMNPMGGGMQRPSGAGPMAGAGMNPAGMGAPQGSQGQYQPPARGQSLSPGMRGQPTQGMPQGPTTAAQGAAASTLFPYRGTKFTPSTPSNAAAGAPNAPQNNSPQSPQGQPLQGQQRPQANSGR